MQFSGKNEHKKDEKINVLIKTTWYKWYISESHLGSSYIHVCPLAYDIEGPIEMAAKGRPTLVS